MDVTLSSLNNRSLEPRASEVFLSSKISHFDLFFSCTISHFDLFSSHHAPHAALRKRPTGQSSTQARCGRCAAFVLKVPSRDLGKALGSQPCNSEASHAAKKRTSIERGIWGLSGQIGRECSVGNKKAPRLLGGLESLNFCFVDLV